MSRTEKVSQIKSDLITKPFFNSYYNYINKVNNKKLFLDILQISEVLILFTTFIKSSIVQLYEFTILWMQFYDL